MEPESHTFFFGKDHLPDLYFLGSMLVLGSLQIFTLLPCGIIQGKHVLQNKHAETVEDVDVAL